MYQLEEKVINVMHSYGAFKFLRDIPVTMVQTAKTRTEHDLLGDKQVPSDCYYGIHTLRALENFQISNQKVGKNLHFIRALAQVKKASAQTNLKFGKISPDVSEAIQLAADRLIDHPDNWSASFPLDIYQGAQALQLI